ncbi:MAG TPA: DUF3857 domain-containing protein [Terriglobales bacterium]|nr:DUF3857 domain-containing protein [Terriglobales bacterium]
MATLRKFRLALLCVLPLLFSGASAPAFAACDALSHSWFDRQIEAKSQRLLAEAHAHDQRSALISVSLLDEISDLREQASCPAVVDGILLQIAADAETQIAVREEAKDLANLSGKSGSASDQRAQALLAWVRNGINDDVEVLNAVFAIRGHHRWVIDELERQRAAELSRSGESWYRVAVASKDDYHRLQAEHRALALDPHYVPALLALARQYSAQGQLTRARSLLLATGSAEPSISALLAEMDINQGHGSAALARLDELRSKPLSPSVAREVATSYAQLGFVKEARNLARYALQLSPSGVEERDLIGELGARGNSRQSSAQQELNSDSDVSDDSAENEVEARGIPNAESEDLRRVLHGDTGSPIKNSRAYFVDAAELIAKWRALPAARRTESRVLADVRVDELHPDYQTQQHVQLVIALSSQADLATYRNRSIQYSPRTQQLSVLHARIHHASGRITDAEDQGESPVADASIASYYDLRAQQYRFRDLAPGDVIEFEYTISPVGNANPYGQYFAALIAFGGPLPCDLQRYVLRSPAAVHLSSAQHLLARAQVHHARTENTYLWEKRHSPALIREPRSPSWSEQGAYLHVSNFGTWQALGKWYADLLHPQLRLSPELVTLASEAVSQHPNRFDRVEAIDDLVLRTTRYVALEFGIYGFKPYPVAQTFSRGFGDCKDKASLMVALLRAAGIDAQIALVRTQHLGDIISQPASVSVFDHDIVYVPEFDLWLDGTAEFARLRELPVQDQGAMALTLDLDGNAVLRRTPRSSADDNYSRRTINARLDMDGTIHFSGATYVRGEDAPELRRQLEVRDAKLVYVRDRLAQVLPAVEIHDVESPVGSPETVSLSFSGDLATYRGLHSASLPSSWMERNYLSTLAPGTTRTQDLILEAPWTTEEEIHIQLPEGAKVTALPDAQAITTAFGTARLEYHVEGNEITVLSTVQFVTTRIAASQFAAFRAFTGGLEKAFHRNIEVALP